MHGTQEVTFDNSKEAAEFVVESHDQGHTVTVANGNEFSSPNMHSHQEYEVAQRDDGVYGVRAKDSAYIYPTPEGTLVFHSE